MTDNFTAPATLPVTITEQDWETGWDERHHARISLVCPLAQAVLRALQLSEWPSRASDQFGCAALRCTLFGQGYAVPKNLEALVRAFDDRQRDFPGEQTGVLMRLIK